MDLKIRKLVNFEEEILLEGTRAAVPPLRLFAVAAVVKNPWFGRGFVQDLNPEIRAFAPILGKKLTERLSPWPGAATGLKPMARLPWPASTANRNMPRP